MAASGSHSRCTVPSPTSQTMSLMSSALMPRRQPPRAVDVGMRHGPARIGLEGQRLGHPARAEIAEQRAVVAVRRVRETVEQAVRALEHRARAREARARQQRGAQARLRRPAGMHALGPGAFGQIFDDAARHAARDAERIDGLLRSSRSAAATPAAAPIAPNTAVGWKPALCTAFGTTRLRRHITSTPTAMPRSAAAPSPCRSQAASTAGTITAPACTGPPSKVSSKSSPCAAVPFTSAAPRPLMGARVADRRAGSVVVATRRASPGRSLRCAP